MADSIQLQSSMKRVLERNANMAIARVVDNDQLEADKGATFRLFHLTRRADGMAGLTELWSGWIGSRRNIQKRGKYDVFSYEKALRLALNHQVHGHLASAQSASGEHHQYQGAVLITGIVPEIDPEGRSLLIASVSGLSAVNDQRTALLTIELMDWSPGVSISQVISVTGDKEYQALRR